MGQFSFRVEHAHLTTIANDGIAQIRPDVRLDARCPLQQILYGQTDVTLMSFAVRFQDGIRILAYEVLDDKTILLGWESEIGSDYVVDSTLNLDVGWSWSSLGFVTADDTITIVSLPAVSGLSRFLRLRLRCP